jgi:hypothetical protein
MMTNVCQNVCQLSGKTNGWRHVRMGCVDEVGEHHAMDISKRKSVGAQDVSASNAWQCL